MRFLVLFLFSATAFAQSPSAIERCRILLTKLETDIELGKTLIKQIQKDFDSVEGKGFSVADLSLYLPLELTYSLFKTLPSYSFLRFSGSETSRTEHVNYLTNKHLPLDPLTDKAFAPLLNWLTHIVQFGFSDGKVLRRDSAELRIINDPWSADNLQINKFHQDGGQITVIIPLVGPGTSYSPFNQNYLSQYTEDFNPSNRGDIFELKRGQMLIFTGTEFKKSAKVATNFQPLGHAAPSIEKQRMLLVVRFSP
jgi:hypothetical protein